MGVWEHEYIYIYGSVELNAIYRNKQPKTTTNNITSIYIFT